MQHGGGNRLDERSQRRRRRGGRSRLAPVQPQHSCRLQGENRDSDWSVCLLETRTLLLILHSFHEESLNMSFLDEVQFYKIKSKK